MTEEHVRDLQPSCNSSIRSLNVTIKNSIGSYNQMLDVEDPPASGDASISTGNAVIITLVVTIIIGIFLGIFFKEICQRLRSMIRYEGGREG